MLGLGYRSVLCLISRVYCGGRLHDQRRSMLSGPIGEYYSALIGKDGMFHGGRQYQC